MLATGDASGAQQMKNLRRFLGRTTPMHKSLMRMPLRRKDILYRHPPPELAIRCKASAKSVSTKPAHHSGERKPARLSGVSMGVRPESFWMMGQRKQAKPPSASAMEMW
jgi:hypothetical protein